MLLIVNKEKETNEELVLKYTLVEYYIVHNQAGEVRSKRDLEMIFKLVGSTETEDVYCPIYRPNYSKNWEGYHETVHNLNIDGVDSFELLSNVRYSFKDSRCRIRNNSGKDDEVLREDIRSRFDGITSKEITNFFDMEELVKKHNIEPMTEDEIKERITGPFSSALDEDIARFMKSHLLRKEEK